MMQSREWRLGSLYRIVDERGISVPFRPNDVQRALWDELWFWNLILKGRQHGISTFICLLMLDSCLFTPNTHCGLIDATLADATKKLDNIRFANGHLPSEIKAFVQSAPTTRPAWNGRMARASMSAPATVGAPCKSCTSVKWARSPPRPLPAPAKSAPAP